ncbi:hypothetical protein ACFQJC_17905 [Haloferax namakaokahaiae]|uniref:Intracellular proteinase inhibitor BsuPI domain-containing protein n=1 Tax=Haloferax namakaokahaiae TaxID=1748331 RepID=A0ABD5ZJC7_9EURY
MSPTRRTMLRSLGLVSLSALAGCLGGNAQPDDGLTDTPGDSTMTENPGGTRPTGTGGPGISLRGVDAAPDIPIEPAVEVSEDTATDDHPPQIRITLTNTSDAEVLVGEGRAIFFEYVADDTRELMFLPPNQEWPAEAGCWRLSDGIAVTEEYRMETFEPGESKTKSVDLYGVMNEEDSCLPVGEFRFETQIAVQGEMGSDSDAQSATWGFSLVLE